MLIPVVQLMLVLFLNIENTNATTCSNTTTRMMTSKITFPPRVITFRRNIKPPPNINTPASQ